MVVVMAAAAVVTIAKNQQHVPFLLFITFANIHSYNVDKYIFLSVKFSEFICLCQVFSRVFDPVQHSFVAVIHSCNWIQVLKIRQYDDFINLARNGRAP